MTTANRVKRVSTALAMVRVAVVDLPRLRKGLGQPLTDGCRGGVALRSQQANNVGSGEDDDGVLVGPDFLVGLPGDVTGGDEYPELAVPQP